MRARGRERHWRMAALLLTVTGGALCAAAQGHGSGGPGGGGLRGGGLGRGEMGGGGFGRSSMPSPRNLSIGKSSPENRVSGLELAPPGRWWDDSSIAKGLRLDSRQQHRMDDVFGANRDTLLKLYTSLQQEESTLAKTIRVKDLDEGQIFQQIDRVTGARAELEKAKVHMSLQIRKEMTAEQMSKLDDFLLQQATPQ